MSTTRSETRRLSDAEQATAIKKLIAHSKREGKRTGNEPGEWLSQTYDDAYGVVCDPEQEELRELLTSRPLDAYNALNDAAEAQDRPVL